MGRIWKDGGEGQSSQPCDYLGWYCVHSHNSPIDIPVLLQATAIVLLTLCDLPTVYPPLLILLMFDGEQHRTTMNLRDSLVRKENTPVDGKNEENEEMVIWIVHH